MLGDLVIVTPPTVLALSLEEAKRQVRRFDNDEDADIEAIVREATEFVEEETRRKLLSTTYDLRLCAFPAAGWIEIQRPPLQSVTSVTYYDQAGAQQTLATSVYRVHAPSQPTGRRGWIELVDGQVWPVTAERDDAVTVRFVAGYGADASTVPAALRRALKLLVSHWYENREPTARAADMPFGIADICGKFRSRPIQRAA